MGASPRPEYIGITGASDNDGKFFAQIRPTLHNNEWYGDKAYKLPDKEDIQDKQEFVVLTPIKQLKQLKQQQAPF